VGELVYDIYQLIWEYNHIRIHSALKMPPLRFAEQCKILAEKVS
jgi:hypothetical protein